jgi:hypothetical protein
MTELEKLLSRSDALGSLLGDEEALEVNAAILDLRPGDPKITNRLGIGLLNNQRPAEAVDVLEAGLRQHPGNSIMRSRLAEAMRGVEKGDAENTRSSRKGVGGSAGSAGWTDFEPDDLVETALAGPGRDACVRLCAASIRASENIDRDRTAVTPIKDGRRFRTIGGIFTGVGPLDDTLTVAVPTSMRSVIRRTEAAGGHEGDRANAVPSVQLIIPRPRVQELFEELAEAHREHLKLSIAAGPPTHLNKHHTGLRRYLLDQADLL